MRRILVTIVWAALTATVLAQTPRSMTLTKPDYFHCTVTYSSLSQDGDLLVIRNAHLAFESGVTVTADEVEFDKGHDGLVKLSGNVQMVLAKK